MDAVAAFLNDYGLIAIFILMLTNGIFSAPASEATLSLAGIYAAHSSVYIGTIVIVAACGNITGALILYYVGYYAGDDWAPRFKEKLEASQSSTIRMLSRAFPNRNALNYFHAKINNNGGIWIGVFRCLPAVRSIVSLPAGMAKMHLLRFTFISLAGILVWCGFWISLGYFLKESWVLYGAMIGAFLTILLFLVIFALHRVAKKDYASWLSRQRAANN